MKEGSFLYDAIVNYHEGEGRAAMIDILSGMTPTAQMLTREYATNSTGGKVAFDNDAVEWLDKIPRDMGGINVKGALTASSLTLESLLALHCGVMLLPVDMLEESQLEIYQPCLPHILDLLNSKKADDDLQLVKERPWKSVLVQSSTDDYDRQSSLIKQTGFDEKIVKETIEDPLAEHYPSRTQEINYFGYSEEEIEPHLKDLIFDAAEEPDSLIPIKHDAHNASSMDVPKDIQERGILRLVESSRFERILEYADKHSTKTTDYKAHSAIRTSAISAFRSSFRHPQLPHIDIEANLTTGMSVLPTVLDLLIESDSLNEADTTIAKTLVHEYQGQSLLRPFTDRDQTGRRVWNIGTINAGGGYGGGYVG